MDSTGGDERVHVVVDSPLGELLAVASRIGIIRLAFDDEDWNDVLDQPSHPITPGKGRRGTDPESIHEKAAAHLDEAVVQLEEYFDGARRSFTVPVDLTSVHGFHRRALEHLMTLGYGATVSYSQVATELGSPHAARAVGTACANNPVPVLVPCHRVLTASGRIGGYNGGLARKRFLLRLEGVAIPR